MLRLLMMISISFVPMSACMSVQPRSTPAERCTEYGYERGTDSYRDCLAEEVRNDRVISQQRSDARRARSQRAMANSAYCQWSPYC